MTRPRMRPPLRPPLRPRALGVAMALMAAAISSGAQTQAPRPAAQSTAVAAPDPATLDYRLQARALAPGVYVVEGANADFSPANGCNIINTGFIVTPDGVLVINTGPSRRYGEQLRALIARTTTAPVRWVLQLNQHPDYFFGHQAFADVPRLATERTRQGVAREAAAYENNLYRLCGDWMRGTETLPPDQTVPAAALAGQPWVLGDRRLRLAELQGHTDSDLVLVDDRSGVAFVGGLVFAQRVPTTPHARVGPWLQSLDALPAALGVPVRWLVPSHGPVQALPPDQPQALAAALAPTRRYLQWLDVRLREAAHRGLDMNEVLRLPPPAEFQTWAAWPAEYVRNVAHLYPAYEQGAWQTAPSRGAR